MPTMHTFENMTYIMQNCFILPHLPGTKAPVLTQQPEAYVEVIKGKTLVLKIEAKGEGPLHYKWFKGTQELQYTTAGDTLCVVSASNLDSGQYCCTVSNSYGSVLSDIVQVKVVHQYSHPPPNLQNSELYVLHYLLRTCSFLDFVALNSFKQYKSIYKHYSV